MIKKVTFEGKNLIIESSSGTFIKNFNVEIDEAIIHMHKIFVTLKLVRYYRDNRNVFCLNENGDILWQIQDPDTYRAGLPKSDSPFAGIIITEDGKLRAVGVDSWRYDVDMETGKLSNVEYYR